MCCGAVALPLFSCLFTPLKRANNKVKRERGGGLGAARPSYLLEVPGQPAVQLLQSHLPPGRVRAAVPRTSTSTLAVEVSSGRRRSARLEDLPGSHLTVCSPQPQSSEPPPPPAPQELTAPPQSKVRTRAGFSSAAGV